MQSDIKTHPSLCAIVAMSLNGVIGINNELPWHLPADLAHFREKTTGFPVIMGRKTYESIGKALPKRLNIVLTHDRDFSAQAVMVCHSLQEALHHPRLCTAEKIFIIGGAKVYQEALPCVDYLYVTVVETVVSGDAYFPTIATNEWKKMAEHRHEADEKNAYAYSFFEWQRI